jgi:hypothetical protein
MLRPDAWIPAFAGMTTEFLVFSTNRTPLRRQLLVRVLDARILAGLGA